MAAIIAALLFYCPTCQSEPTQPCFESGNPVPVHLERTRKAAREIRARRQAGADLFAPEPAAAPEPEPECWEDRYSPKEQEGWGRLEMEAENAWLRAAETNDQYAWEEEQDRLRAAFWGC
ncbi:hypothetical protein [Streptomyces cavernae]|uniref:zinc finger domain-containing protein n=1 Tax=Streptomyces cavernae TaxID=2259034 RepID=UPI000FEBDACD|nr:hypothetical protein [Streptomyces cavernae]